MKWHESTDTVTSDVERSALAANSDTVLAEASASVDDEELRRSRTFELLLKHPWNLMGLVLMALIVVVAVFAPLIATHDPLAIDMGARLEVPSTSNVFGTDQNGRDIFSRVVIGTRISIYGGLLIVLVAFVIGIPVGLLAGWAGGWVDEVLMRLTDTFLAFPGLVLAMGIAAALGPNLRNAAIAIAVTWWPWFARVVRGETIRLKEREFVEAAKVGGASDLWIVVGHIFPNAVVVVLIQVFLSMGYAILTLAGLSFIGVGAQPPTPEWGAMVALGRNYALDQWWVVAFPGAAIMVAVLAFNLVGETLRQVLSPGSSPRTMA